MWSISFLFVALCIMLRANKIYYTTKLLLLILGGCILPKHCLAWFVGTFCRLQFYLKPYRIRGQEHLVEFKKLQRGAMIFNHPTFYDFLILCFALGEIPKMVVNEKYMIGPLKWIAWRFGFIRISPTKTGQSQDIRNAIQNGIQICISPVGHIHQEHKTFHKSIFLARQPILPIVIHYSHVNVWDKQSLFEIVIERLQGPWILFHVEFKPILHPQEVELQCSFQQRSEENMKRYLQAEIHF